MIVEQRTYTLHPGKAAEYLKLYTESGFEIQSRTLGHLFGFFHTEIGPLNQIIHMWAYDDLNQRAERRKELQANKDWQAFVKTIRPLIVKQENKILVPAPFSPPLAPAG